jgi:hypothetical protein
LRGLRQRERAGVQASARAAFVWYLPQLSSEISDISSASSRPVERLWIGHRGTKQKSRRQADFIKFGVLARARLSPYPTITTTRNAAAAASRSEDAASSVGVTLWTGCHNADTAFHNVDGLPECETIMGGDR